MNTEQVINTFCGLGLSKRGGRFPPQKPLMLLYFLGLIYRGHCNSFSFNEIEKPAGNLIFNYGFRDRVIVGPTFWSIGKLNFWILEDANSKTISVENTCPSLGKLREMNLSAKLNDELYSFLYSSNSKVSSVASELLVKYLYTFKVEDIIASIGLENTGTLGMFLTRQLNKTVDERKIKSPFRKSSRSNKKNRKSSTNSRRTSLTLIEKIDHFNSQNLCNSTQLDHFVWNITHLRMIRLRNTFSLSKPLLLLYIFGLVSKGHSNKFPFIKIRNSFHRLLDKYASLSRDEIRELFWFLGNDEGIWYLQDKTGAFLNPSSCCPNTVELRKIGAYGSLEENVFKLFHAYPIYLFKIMHLIVDTYLQKVDVESFLKDMKLGKKVAKTILNVDCKDILSSMEASKANPAVDKFLSTAKNVGIEPAEFKGDQESNDMNLSELTSSNENETDFVNMGTEKAKVSDLEYLLNCSLSTLPERERKLIIQHEGLVGSVKAPTLAELGRSIGVSRERARQLHKRALIHLKNDLTPQLFHLFLVELVTSIAGGEKINLYDLKVHIDNGNHFSMYNELACLKMILDICGYKNVIRNGFFFYRNIVFYTNELPAVPLTDNCELIEWFYGIGETEINLLNQRYDIVTKPHKLLKHSIKSLTWNNLSRNQMFEYLWSSRRYSSVYEKYSVIVERVINAGGIASDDEIVDIVAGIFNTNGLRVAGLLQLLNEMGGSLSFDSKHYLWVVDGFSWKDSDKFNICNGENCSAHFKMMSQSNAAHKILLEIGRPCKFSAIAEIAIERGYIKTRAKNPAGGLKTQVYLEIQQDRKLARDSRFEILDNGFLGLTGKGRELFEGDSRRAKISKGRGSYSDLVYSVLRNSHKSMHYTEIFETLQNRFDYVLNANSCAESIQNALKREEQKNGSRFVEIETGVWALSYLSHSKKQGVITTSKLIISEKDNICDAPNETSDKRKFLDFLGLEAED